MNNLAEILSRLPDSISYELSLLPPTITKQIEELYVLKLANDFREICNKQK